MFTMNYVLLFQHNFAILYTGLPAQDETRPKTKKYDDLKLGFLFLHSIEYFHGLLNDWAEK